MAPPVSKETPFIEFAALKRFAEQYGEIAPPATGDISSFPPTLRALWQHGSEWHFCKKHYNVFGFNVLSPDGIVERTNEVFGDEEMRTEWATQHPSPNCGEPEWSVWAAVSEYDFLFICLDTSSDQWGQLRHVRNNTFEDNRVQRSVDAILKEMLSYLQAYTTDDVAVNDSPLIDIYFEIAKTQL
jgi:hypothetical protein